MADTPKTPTPPRRKAATGARKTTRATPPKAKAPKAEAAATAPVKAPAAPRKAPARKPAAPKAATTTRAKAAAKSASSKVGARATTAANTVAGTASTTARKVADTASTAARSVAHSAPVQLVADTRERMGDRNFFAAVIGGVAALGAAVGGIFFALRDGNPDKPGGRGPKD